MTKSRIGQLIKGYEEILLEEQLYLEVKTTTYEYIKRIGIIIGLNLRFTAKSFYKNKMYTSLKLGDRVLETKKDFIYEKDYKLQCMTVYTTLSTHEKIDRQLQEMKWIDGYTKYISFKNSTPKTRIRALYLNSMNNIQVKYEFLTNCLIYDKVKYNGKQGSVKQNLLEIMDRNYRLFIAIEQGSGKNVMKVFLLVKLNRRAAAQDQISKNIGKELTQIYQ